MTTETPALDAPRPADARELPPLAGPWLPPPWDLAAGAVAGLALGLRSQVYYLVEVGDAWPELRLGLGAAVGALAMVAIMLGLGALSRGALSGAKSWLGRLASILGWSLLPAAALAWALWPGLGEGDPQALGVVAAAWAVGLVLAWWLRPRLAHAAWPGWATALCLAGILILGLGVRLAATDHGLPNFITHCDVPKQISLLPAFGRGELEQPNSYPVGHIYLHAGVLRLVYAGFLHQDFPTSLAPQTLAANADWVRAARGIQAVCGGITVLLAFLIARRLWGDGAALAGALLLAVDGINLTYSAQLMGDSPMVMWVMLGLYMAARASDSGRARDHLILGLAAGLAWCTKMYGAYILIAAPLAWWLGPDRRWWLILLAPAGLILGIIIGTPHLWVDPMGWMNMVIQETLLQLQQGHDRSSWEGVDYFFQGLVHRRGWLWLAGGLAGLCYLVWRHRAKDWLFLVPALVSLALIWVFRLQYLREWDLVNLTPYLALAMAAALPALFQRLGPWPRWRQVAGVALMVFLAWQTALALGDAWVAAFPDTRLFARQWVARYVPPGSSLGVESRLSSGYTEWIPALGYERSPALVRGLVPRKRFPSDHVKRDAYIRERAWLDPTPPYVLMTPAARFNLFHTYWDHPDIRIYLPALDHLRSELIEPHQAASPAGARFWLTPWQRTQPWEATGAEGFPHNVILPGGQPRPAYLALGRGSFRLGGGLGQGRQHQIDKGGSAQGRLALMPQAVPWQAPAWRVDYAPQKDGHLWLGVFAQPWQPLAIMARLGLWPGMQELTRDLPQEAPAEARLFRALALAKLGHAQEADQALQAALKKSPGILAAYLALAQAGPGDLPASLEPLSNTMLLASQGQRICWQGGRACPAQEDAAPGLRYNLAQDADHAHLWLPQTFLPGPWRMKVTVEVPRLAEGQTALLKIENHVPGYHHSVLAQQEIVAGEPDQTLELTIDVAQAPARLELDLTGPPGSKPRLARVEMEPDLARALAWRWQAMEDGLASLPSWPTQP